MDARIYSLRDVKAGYYMNMVILRNAVEAARFFLAIIEDKRSPIAKYPKDYAIFEMAQFNQTTGHITPLTHPLDVTPHSEVDSAIALNTKGA